MNAVEAIQTIFDYVKSRHAMMTARSAKCRLERYPSEADVYMHRAIACQEIQNRISSFARNELRYDVQSECKAVVDIIQVEPKPLEWTTGLEGFFCRIEIVDGLFGNRYTMKAETPLGACAIQYDQADNGEIMNIEIIQTPWGGSMRGEWKTVEEASAAIHSEFAHRIGRTLMEK